MANKVRQGAGVEAGDQVDVSVELDVEPPRVDLPSELFGALASGPQAEADFEPLAFTHRKEYARWVAEAKRDDPPAPRAAGA
jgi:uncharacterized protein YdeI (YjbR/CyaY-like superfamily)